MDTSTYNPTQDRTNITPTGYTFGGTQYTKQTRTDANGNPYTVDVQAGTPTPTVVSNYNTQNKVNDINNTYQTHANTTIPSFPGQNQAVYAPNTEAQGTPGTPGYVAPQSGGFLGYASNQDQYNALTGGQTSQNLNSFGQPFTPPQDAQLQPSGLYLYNGQYYTKDQLSSPESIAAIQNTALQQKSNDAALQRQMDAINKQYDMYRQQQQDITQSGAAGAQAALLQSGAGGRGSIAQYASTTADARVNSILSDGQKALAQLDAQRSQMLSAAQDAYNSNNYKLLGSLNDQIERNRQQMLSVTQAANQKLAQEIQQAHKDTSIASLYDQGITDPTQILEKLQAQGIKNVSLSDIATAEDKLIPTGMKDLLSTLRTSGAPADVVQKVLASKDTVEAYKNAGVWASTGGTGSIGEYNFYKAQALEAGQTPVDYNTYQNIDANRKARIARAGAATYTTDANGNIIPTKPLTETQAKDLTYAQRGTNAMQVIDNLQNTIVKMNPTKYVAEKALENTAIGNAFVNPDVQQYRQAERDFVTAILRRESGASISSSEFDTAERQYFPRPGDSEKTLQQKQQSRETAIASFKANVPGYDARVNAEKSYIKDLHQNIIQSEDDAKQKIIDIGTSKPEIRAQVIQMRKDGASYLDIYNYFNQ